MFPIVSWNEYFWNQLFKKWIFKNLNFENRMPQLQLYFVFFFTKLQYISCDLFYKIKVTRVTTDDLLTSRCVVKCQEQKWNRGFYSQSSKKPHHVTLITFLFTNFFPILHVLSWIMRFQPNSSVIFLRFYDFFAPILCKTTPNSCQSDVILS